MQFLASCASLFWTPAKDATVPNLVPPDRLEQANQLSLLTTYGTAPIAGLVFGLLALISRALGSIPAASHYFTTELNQVNLALYFNAATFVVSALTIYALKEIPRRKASGEISAPSVAKTIVEGWRFIGQTRVVRGIVIGMVGAFAAAGVVVGLGQVYITDTLHGGHAGWGVVFAAIFVGLALGMFLGLRILRGFSRRRLFGLSITFAACPAGADRPDPEPGRGHDPGGPARRVRRRGVRHRVHDRRQRGGRPDPRPDVRVPAVGHAGHHVRRDRRGPVHRGGLHRRGARPERVEHGADRQHRLRRDRRQLRAAARRRGGGRARRGLLPADGRPRRGAAARGPDLGVPRRGSSPRCRRTPTAHEPSSGRPAGCCSPWRAARAPASPPRPGCSRSGCAIRATTWCRRTSPARPRWGCGCARCCSTPRTPACRRGPRPSCTPRTGPSTWPSVILPALERGAIVVTDRYVDSSLAYQGAGRRLPLSDVTDLNKWATGGLVPDLTILLDLAPVEGLGRRERSADRLEAEPLDFHQRVRAGFRALADAEPRTLPGAGRDPAARRDQPRDPGADQAPAPRPGAAGDGGEHRRHPGRAGLRPK